MVKLSLLAAPAKGAVETGNYHYAVSVKHRPPFEARNFAPEVVKALRLSFYISGNFLDRGGQSFCQPCKRPVIQRFDSD